jgi:hypothetical protein
MRASDRALRGEDMRRSRTVRQGASTFRWVTLVGLTTCLAAALAGHPGAAAAEPPDPLRHLAGCFEVSYRFVEDGVHDQDIRGDLLEEITLEERDGVYAFQHYGISQGRRLKHWREEWRRHPDGSFTQIVIGPYGDPRYTCTAPFRFHQWRCATPGAPNPCATGSAPTTRRWTGRTRCRSRPRAGCRRRTTSNAPRRAPRWPTSSAGTSTAGSTRGAVGPCASKGAHPAQTSGALGVRGGARDLLIPLPVGDRRR